MSLVFFTRIEKLPFISVVAASMKRPASSTSTTFTIISGSMASATLPVMITCAKAADMLMQSIVTIIYNLFLIAIIR